jgi:geranylgeranyl diphosphate synthase type II
MHRFGELLEKVEKALAAKNFKLSPAGLYEPISYSLTPGGKRMRPVMMLMACELFDGDIKKAINPALGIEIFHNFTLLHDDIMDKAPLRRGKETVYQKWDTNTAILSGDTMFAFALDCLIETDTLLIPEILRTFSTTARQVCEGQQYDMEFETAEKVTIADYLTMIRLKTAVLPAASLKIGAIIAGAKPQDAENIYRFGENIGLAFQLKDDLLDVFGDEATFGKHCGGDITSNKKTFLYLKAFDLAIGNDQLVLQHYFGGTDFDEETKYREVKRIYENLKIKDFAEKEMDKYYRQSLINLDAIAVEEGKKAELKQFAQRLMKRES